MPTEVVYIHVKDYGHFDVYGFISILHKPVLLTLHFDCQHYTCNSCNTGMRALFDMYAQLPGGIHIRKKSECLVLQLRCNTSHLYEADSLHRVINHPNQYKRNHYIIYACLKLFTMGQ